MFIVLFEVASCRCSQYYALDVPGSLFRPGLIYIPVLSYQQTTEYTCGPASVVSLLSYYGIKAQQMKLAQQMGTSEQFGTFPVRIVSWLNTHGFNARLKKGASLLDIQRNLAARTPVLIDWSDWGGHWVMAVGYDTRNTEEPEDDVIIFADPYDRHDDHEQGLTWFNAERFESMWVDSEGEEGIMVEAHPLKV